MEEYNRIDIQQICSHICSGGTPKSTVAEYYDGNIPWLNTKEINFNRIYETEKTITEEGLNNSSAKWIPANSVIVAMYGATAGKTAITKSLFKNSGKVVLSFFFRLVFGLFPCFLVCC